jgi:hypothetical protein
MFNGVNDVNVPDPIIFGFRLFLIFQFLTVFLGYFVKVVIQKSNFVPETQNCDPEVKILFQKTKILIQKSNFVPETQNFDPEVKILFQKTKILIQKSNFVPETQNFDSEVKFCSRKPKF